MDHSLSLITSQGNLEKKKRYCTQTDYTLMVWPQANREIERKNRTILKRLRTAQAERERRDWRLQMDDFLMMYHNTLH